MRTGSVKRETKETNINIELSLGGGENTKIDTGVAFFDHMLQLLMRHGFMDGKILCKGDVEIDAHHTIEDVGLAFGKALSLALGDKRGITRYGFFILPMDETLVEVALDISGRAFLVYNVDIAPGTMVGNVDGQLFEEFFRAVSQSAQMTLHINCKYGKNIHHILECVFKAFARALANAVALDSRTNSIPSTKGIL